MNPLIICGLFVGSGAAALIYEVVWLQLLQLAIGSSSVSIGVLLATFMGGMGLGGALAPHVVSSRQHPLRLYGWLELTIGLFGILLLWIEPMVGAVYVAWGNADGGGLFLRSLVAGICLLPPTVLMGATLPVVARWVRASPTGICWLGLFYAGNLAGAVLGALAAGFVLLRLFDVAVASYTAVAINLTIGVLGLILAGSAGEALPEASTESRTVTRRQRGGRGVYVAIALSGFCALSGEVVWTRLLALRFGATVYTFSLVLAVFLIGLGGGSAAGAAVARRVRHPRLALGVAQALVIASVGWTAWIVGSVLPAWFVPASLSIELWRKMLADVAIALVTTLPAPLLWGASFPLALAALAAPAGDASRTVGRVYAANTFGAIAGALATSLLLVASIGSQDTQRLMMGLSAVAALAAVLPARGLAAGDATLHTTRFLLPGGCAAAAVLLIMTVPPVPALLIAYGRYAPGIASDASTIIYVGEGRDSSVAVTRDGPDVIRYHNAGKIQASTLPLDMRLQRLLGHLTTLAVSDPRSVLVIGCGAGVTAGAVSVDPRVERVTVAEIEPLVPRVASRFFGSVNHDVLQSPKARVRLDDARHYLQMTDETFAAVTSDPLDPWVRGSAALYTREFFQLVRRRLEPGGVMTLFVQLYDSDADAVKSELATFFEVFPYATVWANVYEGLVQDMVVLGPLEPLQFDLDRLEARWRDPDFGPIAHSLAEVEIYSPVDLLGNYAGRAADLGPWLADAAINRDRNLRLQYLAGRALNLRDSGRIFDQIASYRRFPTDLFVGSPELLDRLDVAFGRGPE